MSCVLLTFALSCVCLVYPRNVLVTLLPLKCAFVLLGDLLVDGPAYLFRSQDKQIKIFSYNYNHTLTKIYIFVILLFLFGKLERCLSTPLE